jgi:hypothetical protein
VLTFSNTINSNNSSASSIALVTPGDSSPFLTDLNQAITLATQLGTPFAYFNVADSSVPGHPASTLGLANNYDTVIVDHSQTNLGTTFAPGQDAFIVLVGTYASGGTAFSITSSLATPGLPVKKVRMTINVNPEYALAA